MNHRKTPKESIKTLLKSKFFYEKQKDTINNINVLLKLSKTYQINGEIEKSFKCLWEAIFLAKKNNNKYYSSEIHRKLAILYSTFNMNDKNTFHLNAALQSAKQNQNQNKSIQLNASYLSLADRECARGNYNIALTYLDSCIIPTNNKEKNYVTVLIEAEKGHLMLKKREYKKAYRHLLKAKKEQQELNVTHSAGILNYLGILKLETKELDSAIFYFNKSLKDIKTKQLPKELTSKVLLNLSNVYVSKRKHQKAYKLLLQSKQITDSLMLVKNSSNNQLLDIKNTYQEELEEKNRILLQQEATLKENQQTQLKLKVILSLLVLVFLISFLIFKMKSKLQTAIQEKKATELRSKIKEQQNQLKITNKNKELTAYALQLIDKDTSIEDLLEVIKNESPNSYKSLHYKYQKSSNDLWKTFNLRFTELNSSFYTKLEQEHPKLTTTEKKHCALIKLKFSTKEISKILNIELHSVHISRSRIRKKMNMDRSENLELYISKLT